MPERKAAPEKLVDRITTLRRRHRLINARLEAEQSRPAPDNRLLRDLQQQHLGLKDAILVSTSMLRRAGGTFPSHSRG